MASRNYNDNQTRQAIYGSAPTLQAGATAYTHHDPRGRSYGGGQSSFNPFAHDGQGHYHNPYDNAPPQVQPQPVAPLGGLHSIGSSNKRRGAPIGGEVVSTQPQIQLDNQSNFLYGAHQELYPPFNSPPSNFPQHPPTTTYGFPTPSQDHHQPWNSIKAAPPSFNYCYGEPQQEFMRETKEFNSRPASRSALGSAGAAMASLDEAGPSPTRWDNQQLPRQPDIYRHEPPPTTQGSQWSGTGAYGHASTRISRPPGGHSQVILG
ncbi:hypothetical protein Ae201684P_015366 [Aphanomyces euteiches]|uniref:Uncharacterized protein n=1 Tax=Aphanomyces euteiches TaxID=100861 RepID=A0A6G0WQN4_9STRA|nr:hypothetical protein Ae201684_012756 [Aphanomyces euteiches]KAH9095562.1 hypothetical protein Ae201684P_015366 [Aphanomyces euteiches]KAH9154268.1 hypothetical protein AeRB84_003596 [Aphanomyces euteiches]